MPTPFVISVSGGSGSCKTTIVNLIKEKVSHLNPSNSSKLLVFNQDHYYRDLSHLPPNERDEVNFDHPASIDAELMSEHLQMLIQGQTIKRPTYDFASHTRTKDHVELKPAETILIDGIFSLHFESLRAITNLKLWIEVSDDLRFVRRLKRDIAERGRSMESVISQYLSTIRPMHKEYIEPSKVYADLVLLWEQTNHQTIDRLVNMLGFGTKM